MDHLAIDFGSRKSRVCVRNSDGSIIEEKRWETLELDEYLAKRPTSRVIVETCAEAFRVADAALALGHEATKTSLCRLAPINGFSLRASKSASTPWPQVIVPLPCEHR